MIDKKKSLQFQYPVANFCFSCALNSVKNAIKIINLSKIQFENLETANLNFFDV